MRSSQVVRASDSQWRSRNCPGFDPSILWHSGIWCAADEAVLNIVHKEKNSQISPFKNKKIIENSVLPVDCEGKEDREPGDPHVEVEEGEKHVRQPPHVYTQT